MRDLPAIIILGVLTIFAVTMLIEGILISFRRQTIPDFFEHGMRGLVQTAIWIAFQVFFVGFAIYANDYWGPENQGTGAAILICGLALGYFFTYVVIRTTDLIYLVSRLARPSRPIIAHQGVRHELRIIPEPSNHRSKLVGRRFGK